MPENRIKRLKSSVATGLYSLVYRLFYRVFPRENTVVGSSFYGAAYENNPRFVFEALEKQFPAIKKVWICRKNSSFDLPPYVKRVDGRIARLYAYATAKVWVDSHQIPTYLSRGEDQLFIEMFHGGLGIKRIANDVKGREENPAPWHTARNASLFVSNSDFMNGVIRSALHYSGKIWKCGYPKNDIFMQKGAQSHAVRAHYGLTENTKILLYVPTYRLNKTDADILGIDFRRLKQALRDRFHAEWAILVHLHPAYQSSMPSISDKYGDEIVDANDYNNIQELLLESDAVISDYSSCIFEAAEKHIPCFTYAVDFEEYKQVQGVYFEMEELPFPYAQNNDELMENIRIFDEKTYRNQWDSFADRMGLVETGNASASVADFIGQFVYTGKALPDGVEE